ncbi:oligosaccharide flippase family protein [Pelagicoccus sp. SDUM812002]|uniref:oligosaccharide flippase family protein n=1 Tax=Pelagicoccus sp. SDUM812002 TaxID=3041266 RepID=UPI00280E2021|nr:oligosaccharide flippase family protein [Pelagicoccus sp. SDUM812002]MDQ8188165.1 oligosaccharide flippase family protein [Pelagicoccus sp. SDUM812002]
MLSSVFSSFVIRVLGAFLAFTMGVVVTRNLGVDDAGVFFWGFSLVALGASVASMGTEVSVVRFAGEQRSAGISVLRKALLLVFVSGSLVAVIYYFAIPLRGVEGNGGAHLRAFTPAFVLSPLLVVVSSYLQGAARVVASVLVLKIVGVLLFCVFIMVAGISSVQASAYAYSLACLVSLLIGVWLLRSVFFCGIGKGVGWRQFARSFFPLWLVVIAGALVQWFSQVIAGVVVDAEEMAWFAAAGRTSMLVNFVLIAVNSVVGPRFAESFRKGGREGDLICIVRWSVRVMIFGSIPLFLFLYLFSVGLMNLYGDGFGFGSGLLRVLLLGQFVCALAGPVGYLLIMTGHEVDAMRGAFAAAGTVVLFTLIAFFKTDVMGFALATAAGVVVQNVYNSFCVWRRLNINILTVWFKLQKGETA